MSNDKLEKIVKVLTAHQDELTVDIDDRKILLKVFKNFISAVNLDTPKDKITEIINLFNEKRFDFNQHVENDENGEYLPFEMLSKRGGRRILLQLIDDNHVDVNLKNRIGDNLLVTALQVKLFNFCNELIKRNADVNNQNFFGNTALHMAASQGDYTQVHWLLSNNANLNIVNKKYLVPAQYVPDDGSELNNYLFEFLEDAAEIVESGGEIKFDDKFLKHIEMNEDGLYVIKMEEKKLKPADKPKIR